MTRIKSIIAELLISSALVSPGFAQVPQQCVTNAVAGGTVDAITVPLLPCGLSTNILILTIAGSNTTTTPTLQMAGFPAQRIYTNTLTDPGIGALGGAGSVVMLASTGTSWLIINGNVGGYIPLPLSVANGGTGAATFTSHGVLYGNTTSAIGVTAAGTTGQVFSGSTGAAPIWTTISSSLVSSLSFGSTGLTPNSATTGAITVAGTLATGSGGTGLTGYTTGDLLYASGASTLSKLAAGTSTQLLHGGTSPSWSAVSLTADVTGTLPIGSGGTGQTSFTSHGLVLGNGASALGVTGAGTTGQLLVGVTGADPVWTSVPAAGVTSISFGSTGLTPSSATGGIVAVAGTLGPASGGTGVANNASSTLTISGNFATTLTVSGTTGLTLPTTGTLATLAGAEALSNKTYSGTSATITDTTFTTSHIGSLTATQLVVTNNSALSTTQIGGLLSAQAGLTVTGAAGTTLSTTQISTLNVSQLATLSAGLTVTGTAGTTLSTTQVSTLNVSQLATLSGGLTVSGAAGATFSTTNVGTLTATGKISDLVGNVRDIPQSGSDKTTSYSLATTDIGQYVGIGTSGAIVIPNSTFSTGNVVSVVNNTASSATITINATTCYITGNTSNKGGGGTMALAARGIATILFYSGTLCYVSGNVS